MWNNLWKAILALFKKKDPVLEHKEEPVDVEKLEITSAVINVINNRYKYKIRNSQNATENMIREFVEMYIAEYDLIKLSDGSWGVYSKEEINKSGFAKIQ